MLSEIIQMDKTIYSEHGYPSLWVIGRDEKSKDFAKGYKGSVGSRNTL